GMARVEQRNLKPARRAPLLSHRQFPFGRMSRPALLFPKIEEVMCGVDGKANVLQQAAVAEEGPAPITSDQKRRLEIQRSAFVGMQPYAYPLKSAFNRPSPGGNSSYFPLSVQKIQVLGDLGIEHRPRCAGV